MPEYIYLPKLELKVKDSFNKIDMIKIMEEWFLECNWYSRDGDKKDWESVYTHVLRSGGNFLDAWLWWRLVKYPFDTTPDTAYLRYLLNVDMHFLGDANEIEVMHQGKKVKLYKGEVKIEISPIIEIDFRDDWKSQGILKLFDTIFKKRIYRKEIEGQKAYVQSQAYKFQGVLKKFFKLETFIPEETVSQPPMGLK